MKKIKVIFLTDWLDNPYKKLLIEHLSYKGVQVEIDRWNLIFLFRYFRLGRPNILHLHTLLSFVAGKNKINRFIKIFLFITQLILLKLIGTQTIWTVHELTDKSQDGKYNISPLQAAVVGKFIRSVITHCDTTKHKIIKLFCLENEDKVFTIPHGNYIGFYENKANRLEFRKTLGIPTENFVFLIFGYIYRYKGVLEAIDTFQALQQDGISLLIAGSCAEDKLEEMILEKIKGYKNISFVHRRIPDDEIQIYMNVCDCVVVPYKVFTTSGVAILAMSFGRACIAPRVGFFSDVLDDSGAFLYDSTQEDGLLQAMKCAVEKKNQILDMGQYNLKLAEQWNWSYVAEQTFNVYRRCLNYQQ